MIKRFEPIEGRNAEIIESLMASPEVAGLSDELKFKIRLCVEEVEENILCYSGTTWVEVWASVSDGVLEIGFRDGGVEFDPLAKPDPDITARLEERQIGGLGIFICKQMMDVLNYRFENSCNIFTMSKKIA
ncbi:MAG: ATP-binding protein [Bacteroidales bacterium]|nr:ATP-binding protein [Candidatus Cryptobacteroides aphodequi]